MAPASSLCKGTFLIIRPVPLWYTHAAVYWVPDFQLPPLVQSQKLQDGLCRNTCGRSVLLTSQENKQRAQIMSGLEPLPVRRDY
jgi:hypothetical protein